MKFAMYEVIELFRAPFGVRANVAVKILLLSLIAIPANVTQHARLIQRLNFIFRKRDLCISLSFSLRCIPFLTDARANYDEVSYRIHLTPQRAQVQPGGNAAL